MEAEETLIEDGVEKLSLGGTSSDDYSSSELDDDEDFYSHLDLGDALKLEIEDGVYTCLICTGDIDSHSKVWNCKTCWRVYDLDCISDWSSRGMKDKANVVDGYQTWKCPSCNTAQYDAAREYTCWCGKMKDPPYNGLMPHSCGQTCSTELGCVHGCSLMCHPGPHAECTAIGPALKCQCGDHKRQLPCIISPYGGWQCDGVCGEMLPCGEHRCKRQCHGGLCGACPELVESTCFCGKVTEAITCADRHGEWSETGGDDKKWIGFFSCDQVCGEQLDCGKHQCESKCHSRRLDDHKCALSPSAGEKCPCGKSQVSEILGHERESCAVAVPTCDATCSRMMKCGHECWAYCHNGECPPCRRILPVKCGCGSQVHDAPCAFQQQGLKAKCNKRCTAMMNCRRHRCTKVCCDHEQVALERERARKKRLRGNLSGAGDEEVGIESVHQCDNVCNKMLNCGKHRCVMTCHAGQCRPCIESSPNDYRCPCSRTVLQAPIRCGSMLPKCRYPCMREPACGHARVEHDCHGDDVECPKCPYTVEKVCVCSRNIVKGVQCHRASVSCGYACNDPLPCGHKCPKVCHPDGQCETNCRQPCGKPLPCGHPHKTPCHEAQTCDDGRCDEIVSLACECGHLNKKQKCEQRVIEPLQCDESCLVAKRNRMLAEALKINVAEHEAAVTHHEYNEDLLDIYHADPSWGDGVEEQLIQFAHSAANPDAKKVLKFPPMKANRRMFVHLLCEEFNLTSVAQDAEPNRSVVVMNAERAKVPPARLRRYYNPW